jgi:hypothetical protein
MDFASAPRQEPDPTKQNNARLLQQLCNNGFDGSISACALALGRDAQEIGDMLNESSAVDEDLVMKIRGIAEERGIEIAS